MGENTLGGSPSSLGKASERSDEKDGVEAQHSSFESVKSLGRLIHLPNKAAPLCPWVILTEDSYIRRIWNMIVLFLLLYTATYFPFQLCFIDLQVNQEMQATQGMLDRPLDFVVNCLFYVDLVLNFFLSYKNSKGHEVIDLKLTARNYLRTYFVPNLVACIPPQLIEAIAAADVRADILEVTRFSRLQRMSRLARLVRLIQLSKLIRFLDESPMVTQFRNLRGVRIINLFCMLSWVAHMVCCGWYLCAALQTSVPYQDTWLGMRIVDSSGGNLVFKGDGTLQSPEVQWLHSFYFVLTVFTTVGFGDMSAFTEAEIGYVCFTMLLGAIVNSIILNEVISTLTRLDENSTRVQQQMQVVQDFSEHCNLARPLRKQLVRWARENRAEKHGFDRAWMRELLTNGSMPIRLVGQLPSAIFSGKLVRNRFLSVCSRKFQHGLPPRFYMLLALQLDILDFEKDQMVYHCHDQAFSIYLVLKGVFASVALPSPEGGVIENVDFLADVMELLKNAKTRSTEQSWRSWLFRGGRSFGTFSSFLEDDILERPKMLRLSPFLLHCEGSYFGDIEVLATPPLQRLSSVRCEREGGKLLQLHKDKLQRLLKDFPDCLSAWLTQARRHAQKRSTKLRTLTTPMDIMDLAKRDIQLAVVNVWQRKGTSSSRSLDGDRPPIVASRSNGSEVQLKSEVTGSVTAADSTEALQAEVKQMKGQMKEMNRQMAQLRSGQATLQDSLKDVLCLLRSQAKCTPSEWFSHEHVSTV